MKIRFRDQETEFEIGGIKDMFESNPSNAAVLTADLIKRLRKQHRNAEIRKVVTVIKDILKDLPERDRQDFLAAYDQAQR